MPAMFLCTAFRSPVGAIRARPSHALKAFTTSALVAAKSLPPRILIDENDLEENFLKGSGPGGQKINKTSSAVQLKHLPTGMVIKCQSTRSRTQNRKIARRQLADKVEFLQKGPESRIALREERLRQKKASKRNKTLKKYRKLFGQDDEDEEEVEDVDTKEVNAEKVEQKKEKEELGEGKRM